MGEPPIQLHDWFAAVASSTLSGDRELAVVFHGRVETADGLETRPTALQLVKRLGSDAFRTQWEGQARTVKLVGPLARERAVAGGIDDVAIATFKDGISPHFEFFLHAAREQRPTKVNLRAAFPPPPKQLASMASPEPTTRSRQSTPPPRRSAFLNLGSAHDEQLAGAPGSMHELAEGLRRARQLRRPVGSQTRSALPKNEERPILQADRDAGWARRPVASAADGLRPVQPELERSPEPKSTNMGSFEELPVTTARPETSPELPPKTTDAILDSSAKLQQGATTDLGGAHQPDGTPRAAPTVLITSDRHPTSLIRIDCKPKTLKQALAATVVRFFAASHPPRQTPSSVQSSDPSAAEVSALVEPAVKSSPRRSVARISRFQANVTATLQRSDPLRAISESPANTSNVDTWEDGGDVQLQAQAEPLAEESMAVDVALPIADAAPRTTLEDSCRDEFDQGSLTFDAPSGREKSDHSEDPAAMGDVSPNLTGQEASASPDEQTEKVVCGGSSARQVPTPSARPTSSLAVAFAEVEPSSDRQSSVEPAFRSSQGFSSMYGESEPEDDDDDAGKAAEEISAFIARDLASSVADEEEDAERARAIDNRPLVDAASAAKASATEAAADAAPVVPGAGIDLCTAVCDARTNTETTMPDIPATAACDSEPTPLPVLVETEPAVSRADAASIHAEVEEEPVGVQAEIPAAPSRIMQTSESPFEESSPPQLPARDLPIAIPHGGASTPRLPTPPLSPPPIDISAPTEDHYAPEESKDAYFVLDEERSHDPAEQEVADEITNVAFSAAHEVLQEMQQPRPSDSRSSSISGISSPQRAQEPRLFRDNSVDPYADITDEGALAALAALRSSPASTPEYGETGSRGSSVDVFGQKRYLQKPGSAPQPVHPARARTMSAGGQEVVQPEAARPALDGPRTRHQPASKKRKRKASPSFTLEIFTSKSPRKRAPPLKPPVVPAQPVASTSKVTLEDLAERTPSNGAKRAKSRTADRAIRIPTGPEEGSAREHAERSNPLEAADLDYNSDSDDPLSAPIRSARPSASAKRSGGAGTSVTSRGVPSDERDSDEEEESQIVEQALLTKPSRPRPSLNAKEAAQPQKTVVQQPNGSHPAHRSSPARRDLSKPPRKPSLAGKIRPDAPPAFSQGAPARPRPSSQTRPPAGGHLRHARPTAHPAPASSSSRSSVVRREVDGPAPRKRSRSQSEDVSEDEAEPAPPTVTAQRPLQARDRPPAHTKSAVRGQPHRPSNGEATQHVRGPPRPVTSPIDRRRSSSRGSVEIEDGDGAPLHDGEESGHDSEQASTPARPPPTEAKSTKKRKKRKSVVMPRSKSRKRPSAATPKPTKARSLSPELTASPEPTPRSKATKAGSKRRRAEPGGRGSKKARHAYDHAEWGEEQSD